MSDALEIGAVCSLFGALAELWVFYAYSSITALALAISFALMCAFAVTTLRVER